LRSPNQLFRLEPGLSNWTVLCDFDGTVSLEDVTDSLLLRFGRPGWDVFEAKWRAGHIGSLECMAAQVALLDCSADELDEHLASVAIDPDFFEFVRAIEKRRWPLTILSDGLDYAISSVLTRHGLGHLSVVANRLEPTGPRSWRLAFPNTKTGCTSGTCKCAFAPATGPRVLLVGDGASDFCVAARADISFARKRLLDHCLDNALTHQPVANFKQALALLPGLAEFPPAIEDDLHA
jgi:2-hydroxy-3-keto-5-methylthiopentenyl-1-phosphate phosphatase